MLEVNQICKNYGSHKALDHLSFSLKKGTIVALLGPNGAGKSTTMKILTGFLNPDFGTVHFKGQLFLGQNKIKQKIGYLPENNPLYPDLLVREYLQFIAGIYKLSWSSKEVKYILEKLGLAHKMNHKIQDLSKGYKQRVGIAQTLLHQPDLLILDEPTTGLDPNQIVEIRALIQELAVDRTILLSTHILQEVQICSDVLILNQGKIVAHQKTDTFEDILIQVETENPLFFNTISAWSEVKNITQLAAFSYEIVGKKKDCLRQKIAAWALVHQVLLTTLSEKEGGIEKIFQDLTRE